MSYELIAIIILLGSLAGMAVIIFRKIPVLASLPTQPTAGYPPQKKEINLFLKLKEKIKALNPFKNFSLEIFLQKILSRIRILSLKMDTKTWSWLQKLRERAQKKKLENDQYWEEIKKSTKK